MTLPSWLTSDELGWFDLLAAPLAIGWFVTAYRCLPLRRDGHEPAPISRRRLHHINQQIREGEGR